MSISIIMLILQTSLNSYTKITFFETLVVEHFLCMLKDSNIIILFERGRLRFGQNIKEEEGKKDATAGRIDHPNWGM